ncbi:tetratricopeptide repeat protein [Allonocardiopsis opalescens]|uniref:Tetratricopeptide repeat protein n=2 Tax=Allonocardiopsis opalescens TaxID=1144618 RepID=A0A2T0Q041_9ACTN|nr:tetratricopeptide repeat protein [Allonocardiopsis opalescens]
MSGLVAREGAFRVSVGTLSEAESVHLLRTVMSGYRSSEDDEELAELARLCARLPLALRIVAERAVVRPRMPLRALIAELRDESGLWDALSTEDAEEADAVRTVFAWSYRALSPQAARVFRLLGLHPGPEIGVEAAAALTAMATSEARRQLDTLAGAHLLEECGHDRYQFHDLLRAYAVDQSRSEDSEAERRTARSRVFGWYLHGASAAARSASSGYTPPVEPEPLPAGVMAAAFEDRKAAIAWYETERDNLSSVTRAAHAAGMERIAWQIPAVLTMIIADREPADAWLPTQRTALEAARRAGDRYGEAITHDNLGIAYRHLFRLLQAEEHFTAAQTAFRELGDTFGDARATNGLGVCHMFAHRVERAARCFEEALALVKELGDQAYTGYFTRNLGWALLEAERLDRAEALLRQAAELLRAVNEPLEVAEALTLLAAVLWRSRRFGEAQETAERALAIAGDFDGTLFQALALLELGRIALARDDGAEALPHLQQAAILFQQVGRPDLQAAAWDTTGEAYLLLGRTGEAVEFSRQASTAHRGRGDQWALAISLSNLAKALAGTGDLREARNQQREAVRLLADFPDPSAMRRRAELQEDSGGD